MPMITEDYATKKAFTEAVQENSNQVFLTDPSFFNPPIANGTVAQFGAVYAGKSIAVTNMPKRSWFASVNFDERGNVRSVK